MTAPKAPANVEAMDWRINNLAWTTQPFTYPATGEILSAGAALMQAALLNLGTKKGGISVPNATALFLNLSKSHLDRAKESIAACHQSNDPHGHLPEVDSFGAIENYLASVLFACTALEAFANEIIPDSYVHVITKKGAVQNYNKEEIERRLGPLEKLGDVVPKAIGVATPKSGKLWEPCRKLFDLRDRIVHMKTADREFNGDARTASSIWNELLRDPLPNTYAVAQSLIGHFYTAKGATPRWFEKCPF